VQARIVLTDSLVNPGDSGSVVVNDQGELVAIASGYDPQARGCSLFIDIRLPPDQREHMKDTVRAEIRSAVLHYADGVDKIASRLHPLTNGRS
jgi:hypothetical protein